MSQNAQITYMRKPSNTLRLRQATQLHPILEIDLHFLEALMNPLQQLSLWWSDLIGKGSSNGSSLNDDPIKG